jgi:serpin B
MAYAGARGDTATEIAHALHSELPPDAWHAAFNALDQQLEAPRAAPVIGGDPFQLSVTDALWAQSGYPLRQQYLDTLAADYGAALHLADFEHDPDEARAAINAYVADHTDDRIRELLSRDTIDQLTRLVLLNTVAFKASWYGPFAPSPALPFHLPNGSVAATQAMTTTSGMGLVNAPDYDALRIPYVGGTSMSLIVPKQGNYDSVEHALASGLLDDIRAREKQAIVELTMPKFRFASTLQLNQTLQALGVRAAFTPPTESSGADFTGLTPARELYVRTVLQQATIDVDEHGTEAAAATAGEFVPISSASTATIVTIDRPFIFLIQDDTTGAILFLGRVLDPS